MERARKIVAAMSGGVDSTVAAFIYKKKGFDVVGATLKLLDGERHFSQLEKVVAQLGIEHHFVDARDDFKKNVLKKSWDEYSSARTPNPCAICNRYLKFGRLLDYAVSMGAEGIITGHYVHKIKKPDGSFAIKRGDDPLKDQSYFLFALTKEQLARADFPLGNMTKSEVRAYAAELGLPNAAKKGSQDACFSVQGEALAETLRKTFDGEFRKGFFVAPDGTRLGEHQGIQNYTIGQRKGLGIALGKPGYVSRIDYDSGDVVVTTYEDDLLVDSMIVDELNWQQDGFADGDFECDVQIRYRSSPVAARVIHLPDGSASVQFAEPRRAVTPGQAAVFFVDDCVAGGGWIRKLD